MAHTKSALKDIRKSRQARDVNRQTEGSMKTAMKKFIARTDAAGADEAYRKAVKLVDKAAHKNVIHRNAASRRKGQLDRKLSALKSAGGAK
ncbi:MAG: 30S ribosomal protein S20 [Planctomycetes bacterium]|nr:30S ribosomal protein S20 [Planctomycetota bacterium]